MKKNAIVSIFLAGLQFSGWSWASAGNNSVQLLFTGYVKPKEGHVLVPGWCEKPGDTYPDPTPDDPYNVSVCTKAGARYVQSTIALVEGNGVKLIVDPGFIGEDGDDLLQVLGGISVAPGAITHVFISHHHPDHTLYAGLFPNATLVDFWATYKGDLWEDHADNYKIAPGIRVVRTPGHTDEDASLVVKTKDGTVVFTHVHWFNTPDGPFPSEDPLAEDPEALEASRDYVYEVADCIVPGHGERYPNPTKEGVDCMFVGGQ